MDIDYNDGVENGHSCNWIFDLTSYHSNLFSSTLYLLPMQLLHYHSRFLHL